MNRETVCKSRGPKTVEVATDSFGFVPRPHGEHIQIKRFTWKNSNRIQIQVITYGATITSMRFPGKNGVVEDVVLGFEDIQSYIEYHQYNFGSSIGRVANYIRDGTFSLNKKDVTLSCNAGRHHYNGGNKGFEQVIWNYYVSGNKVILSHLSSDNEEGYPGDLLVFGIFELTNTNEFRIEYKATSSKSTLVNLTNHSYFNLAGHATGEDEMKRHTLMVNADCHTLVGADSLPTGEIQSVLNTVYDFQTPVKLGIVLEKLDGFNNNLCVNRGIEQQGINFVTRLYHPTSGRILEVYSNQYGVQIDTANTLPLKHEAPGNNSSTQVIKSSKISPFLRSSLSTFDILDEIYNKVVAVRILEEREDFGNLLDVIQDLQKKSNNAYRSQQIPDANSLVKRGIITLENLPAFQLGPLQVKYLERILKSMDKIQKSPGIDSIRAFMELSIDNNSNKNQTNQTNLERKKNSSQLNNSVKVIKGKKGAKYNRHGAISFQCQNYPDAVHYSNFPSPVLKPGQVYSNVIIYKFWIKTDQSGVSGVL